MRKILALLLCTLILTGCSATPQGATNPQKSTVTDTEKEPIQLKQCIQFFDTIKYGDYVCSIDDEYDIFYKTGDCGVAVGSAIPGTGASTVVTCNDFIKKDSVEVSIAGCKLHYSLSECIAPCGNLEINQILSRGDNYLGIATKDCCYVFVLESYECGGNYE